MENDIQINKINFFDLFINNKFLKIPIFQRNFVWKKEEVAEFILSIIEEFQEKQKSRQKIYLGNILTVEDEEEQKDLLIIDGQQRITMFLILLEEIKDKLKTIKIKEIIDPITYQNLIYNINNLILEDKETKLFFDNNIYNIEWRNNQNKKINSARQIIRKIINDDLLNEHERKNNYYAFHKLNNFFNFCKERIIIGHVKIEDIKESVDIFEKMNGNKVELTDWDLVKALYIKKCQTIEEEYKEEIISLNKNFIEKFKKINIVISENDFSEIMTFYITKKIIKKQKYTKILDTIRTEDLSIIDLLENFNKKYLKLINLIKGDFQLEFYFYLVKVFNFKSIKKYFIAILLKEIDDFDKMKYLKNKMIQITLLYLIYVSLYKERANWLENILKNLLSNWLKNDFKESEQDFKDLFELYQDIISDEQEQEKFMLEISKNKKNNILFAYILSDLSSEWLKKIINYDLKVEEVTKIGNFNDDNSKINNLIVLDERINKSKSLDNLAFINEIKNKLSIFINKVNDNDYKNSFILKDYQYITKMLSNEENFKFYKKERTKFLQNHIWEIVKNLNSNLST